jgi:hypothetical protein
MDKSFYNEGVAHRVLIADCELHVALQLERGMTRVGNVVRILSEGEDLGATIADFDPSHIFAGTEKTFQAANAIVEKRGSPVKVARFR